MCLRRHFCTYWTEHSCLASWAAQIRKCSVNSAPLVSGRKQHDQYIVNHCFNVVKPDVDKHENGWIRGMENKDEGLPVNEQL